VLKPKQLPLVAGGGRKAGEKEDRGGSSGRTFSEERGRGRRRKGVPVRIMGTRGRAGEEGGGWGHEDLDLGKKGRYH